MNLSKEDGESLVPSVVRGVGYFSHRDELDATMAEVIDFIIANPLAPAAADYGFARARGYVPADLPDWDSLKPMIRLRHELLRVVVTTVDRLLKAEIARVVTPDVVIPEAFSLPTEGTLMELNPAPLETMPGRVLVRADGADFGAVPLVEPTVEEPSPPPTVEQIVGQANPEPAPSSSTRKR